METKIVKVNGVELEVKITGKGRPVLVVNDTVFYPPIFPETLKQQYQWVFAESRMFEPTPEGFDRTTPLMQLMADEVEIIRNELGLGKVTVMGHSALSVLAMEYARRYPDHITGVVLLGLCPNEGPGYNAACQAMQAAADPERLAIIAQRWEAFGGQDKLAAMSPYESIIPFFLNNGPLFWYDMHFDATALFEGYRINGEIASLAMTQAADFDVGKEPRINTPVFIGVGKYDFINPYTLWTDAEKARIPNLTFHLFEKSGHMMMYEEPEEFERVFNQWMNSH
jgi:proline iminopeptidase